MLHRKERSRHSLRRGNPPVVARILEDRLVLDLRTVADAEEAELLDALSALSAV